LYLRKYPDLEQTMRSRYQHNVRNGIVEPSTNEVVQIENDYDQIHGQEFVPYVPNGRTNSDIPHGMYVVYVCNPLMLLYVHT